MAAIPRVLFICHGNICRSPMAEYVFKHLAKARGLAVEAESAATSGEELGNPVYPPARLELARHGVPNPPRRARQVCAQDVERFDYLVVMDGRNVRNLRRILGEKGQDKVFKLLDFARDCAPLQAPDIADPWYTGDFALTYAEVEEGCAALLDRLQAE